MRKPLLTVLVEVRRAEYVRALQADQDSYTLSILIYVILFMHDVTAKGRQFAANGR